MIVGRFTRVSRTTARAFLCAPTGRRSQAGAPVIRPGSSARRTFSFKVNGALRGLAPGAAFGVARYAFTVTDLHRLPSAGLPAHPSTHEAAYLEFTRISPV